MKILLATDGSVYSTAAAEEVAGWLLPPNTELRVVSAYEDPALILTGNMEGAYTNPATMPKKPAEDAVYKVAALLKKSHANIPISTAVVVGAPKLVILNSADAFGADLIVVGSHGRNAVERFLLGSVSHAIAVHAKCSVEIVRKRNIKEESE